MAHRFQNGDEVVHKSDKGHLMIVAGHLSDGKAVCRWKVKDGFKTEEFFEEELEKWVEPTVEYGDHQTDIDNIRW